MTEIWKQISNHPDYEVSNYGGVRSWKNGAYGRRNTPKVLKPVDNQNYLNIVLYKNGKTKMCKVHRLVLETFVGPCPDGMMCCHNNGMRDDNNLENLRWDTNIGNYQDSVVHGTAPIGERHGRAKLKWLEVLEIRRIVGLGFHKTLVSKMFKVSRSTINDIITRRIWAY